MSTIKTKKVQVGTDSTASNNFTIYTPGTPDGTVRIGNGNADSVTDAITLDSSGNITAAQNLTVSGTTAATGAITSTGGIYLGGTASANLLDNYEEGTWTPRFIRSTDQTELNVTTYSQEWGIYQRVGQWVTVQCDIGTTNTGSVGSPGGNLWIGPLPFTPAATGQYSGNSVGFAKRFSNPAPRSVLILGGVSYCILYHVDYSTNELDEVYTANELAISTSGEYNRTMFQITYPITGSE